MEQNLQPDFESRGMLGKKDQTAWLKTNDTGDLYPDKIAPQDNWKNTASDEDKVFVLRGELKLAVSRIAMHLSQELRNKIFADIDYLYDGDAYEEGEDAPIEISSFYTFLRFMIYNGIKVAPLLGVSDEGYLLAVWRENNRKYFFEFLANDSIRLNYYIEHPDSETTVTSSSGKSKNLMQDILPNAEFTAWQKELN